jgi:hypothetical protein
VAVLLPPAVIERWSISNSAEVSENSVLIKLSRRDGILIAVALVVLVFLWLAAGWRIALLVAGGAALGTGFIDEIQRRDIRVFGR